jgi:transposase
MNDESEIKKFFLQYGPLVCAIENCRGVEWFVEIVKDCGCEVRVANTFAVKQIAQTAKKTDKVDSKILMELVARSHRRYAGSIWADLGWISASAMALISRL